MRLAFVLAGVDFKDERISFSDWAELKGSTRYGQLPSLKIGPSDGACDELYQSAAMLKYVALAEKETLYPVQDLAKCVHIEEVLGLLDDLARAWRPCVVVASSPQQFGFPEDMSAEDKDDLAKRLREKFLAEELPPCLDAWIPVPRQSIVRDPGPTPPPTTRSPTDRREFGWTRKRIGSM